MLVNWDAEKIVWDRLFAKDALDVRVHGPTWLLMLTHKVEPTETSLLVTEPYFNLPNIAETYDQMIFEEWEFDSYFRCTRKLNPSIQTHLKLLHYCRMAVCLATLHPRRNASSLWT